MKAIQDIIDNIEKVIIGKREVIELAVISLISQGHILIEDVPGTGKTMMARALAKSVDVDTKRLQCTPDLLPSDITGVPIYNQKTSEFVFRPGPIFTNFLLADEINRATPRAQSALLECMEEFRVSVDGETHKLPPLFMVLATQNPIDMAGTHVLPEAQLDRFFVRLSLGYPSMDGEINMMKAQASKHPIDELKPVANEASIIEARQEVRKVHLSTDVAKYIAQITSATRQHPDLKLGASPRGTLALARGARAYAFLRGRDYVTPDMVRSMAHAVLEHRLIIRPQASSLGKTSESILKEVLNKVAPPI